MYWGLLKFVSESSAHFYQPTAVFSDLRWTPQGRPIHEWIESLCHVFNLTVETLEKLEGVEDEWLRGCFKCLAKVNLNVNVFRPPRRSMVKTPLTILWIHSMKFSIHDGKRENFRRHGHWQLYHPNTHAKLENFNWLRQLPINSLGQLCFVEHLSAKWPLSVVLGGEQTSIRVSEKISETA